MFSNIAFIFRFKKLNEINYNVYKFFFDYDSKKWVKVTSNFWNCFQLKPHLHHFIYTYYTKINSIFIPDYVRIPGIMLSIPEKRFLLSFLSVFIFYFLGLTKIWINMYQNTFWISKVKFLHVN